MRWSLKKQQRRNDRGGNYPLEKAAPSCREEHAFCRNFRQGSRERAPGERAIWDKQVVWQEENDNDIQSYSNDSSCVFYFPQPSAHSLLERAVRLRILAIPPRRAVHTHEFYLTTFTHLPHLTHPTAFQRHQNPPCC